MVSGASDRDVTMLPLQMACVISLKFTRDKDMTSFPGNPAVHSWLNFI